ncbi:MAG: hypothetical protein QOG62_136 [Thermoleophilaceae bacterium]|jgi:DNA-binding NarL/FixJ family response regulator|nr:hypothetical protein [Thermoleophilaceae bacterium]
MSAVAEARALGVPLETFEALVSARARLRESVTVGELFARAVEIACADFGFNRGLVLSVGHSALSGGESDPLDGASDMLRRSVLSSPIPIRPHTLEHDLIEGISSDPARRASAVQDQLSLGHVAMGAIVPETHVLALLVLDRDAPEVTPVDRAVVAGFATIIAGCVERVVLRARSVEVSSELRYMSASAQALMAEILEAPVSLPSDQGHGPTFAPGGRVDSGNRGRMVLSVRERQVAALLAEGRSNRDIARELVVSPETVKGHVGRILRKLNASNRAEAVARYLGPGEDS